MTPRLRRFAFTVHVASSVGWLGAATAYLGLVVAALTSEDAQLVRAAYLAMEPIAWLAIVPLAFASLVTGLVQGLGTQWGLFRHYWVLFKLIINVFATIVLLMYMQSLGYLARLASATSSDGDLAGLRSGSPVLHATAALVLLVVATVLAIYKPRGVTRYGWRRQHAL